jgi:hypothetical protein
MELCRTLAFPQRVQPRQHAIIASSRSTKLPHGSPSLAHAKLRSFSGLSMEGYNYKMANKYPDAEKQDSQPFLIWS